MISLRAILLPGLAFATFGAVGCGEESRPTHVVPVEDVGVVDTAFDGEPGDSRDASEVESSLDASDAVADYGEGGGTCRGLGTECIPIEYCESTGCGDGVCKPRPAPSKVWDPVCGCNGVSYWNRALAESLGAAVWKVGACGNKTVSDPTFLCSPTSACPGTGAKCVEDRTPAGGCSAPIPAGSGKCWAVPAGATCPSGSGTHGTCPPVAPACMTECEAVLSGKAFESGC